MDSSAQASVSPMGPVFSPGQLLNVRGVCGGWGRNPHPLPSLTKPLESPGTELVVILGSLLSLLVLKSLLISVVCRSGIFASGRQSVGSRVFPPGPAPWGPSLDPPGVGCLNEEGEQLELQIGIPESGDQGTRFSE